MAAAKSRASKANGVGEVIGVVAGVVVFVLLLGWLGWYVTGWLGWDGHARWCAAGACASPLAWRYIKTAALLLFAL
ncbi:MAG TPA: hypothetical protein VGL93_10295 [Streptosporangiaceae bacterium]